MRVLCKLLRDIVSYNFCFETDIKLGTLWKASLENASNDDQLLSKNGLQIKLPKLSGSSCYCQFMSQLERCDV